MTRAASLVWNAFRLPVLTFLVVLAPLVRFALATLALLGILVTFFFKFFGAPDFPFWTMVSISLGFAFALMLYEALIRFFSR